MSIQEKLKKEREEADKMMNDMQQGRQDNNSDTPPDNIPQKDDVKDDTPQQADSNQDVARLQAEVDRLRAQLDDENNQTFKSQALLYKSRLQALSEQFQELKESYKALSEAQQQKHDDEPPAKKRNSNQPDEDDEDYQTLVEEYGEKSAKAIWRMQQKNKGNSISPEDIAKIVEEKTKPVTEELATVKNSQNATTVDRFFSKLTEQHPDWKQLNGWEPEGIAINPKFKEFLGEQVPYQDYTFNDMLNHYYKLGDLGKVSSVFKAFKDRNPVVEQKKENPLEQHLEPDKTGKGGNPPPDRNQKPVYTRAEIEAFDKKKRAGTLFSMTPDEIQAQSKLYQDAIFEGRVR